MTIPDTNQLTQRPYANLREKQDGFVASVLFIALLAIMLILATAGGMALIHLHNEVKILERQQIKRLISSETNAVATPQIHVSRTKSK